MKRFGASAILLLGLFACGKKEEPPPAPPASEAAPQAAQSPAVSQPQAGAEPAMSGNEKAKPADGMYTVAKGDSLYKIAKSHGLKHRDLAKWNKIKDPRRLRIGQELRLNAPGS